MKYTDIISPDEIKKYVNESIDIILLDTADSTNNVSKQLGSRGCPENTLVIAKKQTQGRGRMGRSFISNEENGIYMSLLLRPELSPSRCIDITVIGAVSVSNAIEEICNVKTGIKWVNDIYIENKKVCGILTEAASLSCEQLDYAVIGIGINVTEPKGGFSDEIKDIATSLYEKNAPVGTKNRLIASIINNFLTYYRNIENRSYIKAYREKSNLIGKMVDIYRGDEIISGICVDINENAELVIERDGKVLTFNSGDARARRK